MPPEHVLAIDFGTSNTYFSKCPADQLSPRGVDFGDGRDGLATAILYRKGRSAYVGHNAINEYSEATQHERNDYILRTNFKPDIATSEESKRNAIDFLGKVLENARKENLDIKPQTKKVIFGVPSEADADFRKTLMAVAMEAGYGDIEMLDEPKGALLYHLFHKDIPVSDAQRGVLVIDFGGGTCDFAYLLRGQVKRSWGDMLLGGRLFDDIFFQWFLDQNPGGLKAIQNDGREYFILSYICRKLKEDFSRTMSRDRSEMCNKAVDRYGHISGMTWDTFLDRVSCYVPSKSFSRFLADTGVALPIREKINILDWFCNCLRKGLQDKNIEKSEIHRVILAGGSSLWPFVLDIIQQELFVNTANIMRSERPYAAISEGISLQPALMSEFRKQQEKLSEDFPKFIRDKVNPHIRKRLDQFTNDTASTITQELFDAQIRPILKQYREEGGSIAGLKAQIANAAASFEPKLKMLVHDKISVLGEALPVEVEKMVAEWFSQHNLTPPEGDMVAQFRGSTEISPNTEKIDFYDKIAETINKVGSGIIALITAAICGGGGTAIIMAGPIGWLIGLILGGIVAYLAIEHGKEKARQIAEDIKLPSSIIWLLRIVTDGNISKIRAEMNKDIKLQIRQSKEFPEIQDLLEKEISERVDREIQNLRDINLM